MTKIDQNFYRQILAGKVDKSVIFLFYKGYLDGEVRNTRFNYPTGIAYYKRDLVK